VSTIQKQGSSWNISVAQRRIAKDACQCPIFRTGWTHMVGAIDASKAPRMNRKTKSPGKEVNAARIMQEDDHPKKQKQIQ
jgi:hypothetical protein